MYFKSDYWVKKWLIIYKFAFVYSTKKIFTRDFIFEKKIIVKIKKGEESYFKTALTWKYRKKKQE